MNKTKMVKIVIVVSLILAESFVWTNISAGGFSINGIIGGADGPTSITVSNGGAQEDPKEKDQQKPNQEGDKNPVNEISKEERSQLLEEASDKGLLVLVNKSNSVDENYKPEDLVEIKYYASDRPASARFMRAEAADAFHKLVETAAGEDIKLVMTTAYRSYEFQESLYNGYVSSGGVEEANKFSAKPGQSEHQTGLSVDVSSPSVDYQLTSSFGDEKEGKWLADNAHKFGFIIRFPEGKESVTGYNYEPWHIRYVGVFAAGEIYDQGITLEEYLDKIEK